MKIVKATSTVQMENERVIVTEWRFAPGAETGHHVHAHDYVVVPLTSEAVAGEICTEAIAAPVTVTAIVEDTPPLETVIVSAVMLVLTTVPPT